MNKPNSQQQQQTQQQQSQQQSQPQMEGQVQQVEISHDGSQQMHPQGAQVVSSGAPPTMVVAASQQSILQQAGYDNTKTILQSPPTIAPMPSQGGSTITTMSGPPQQVTDWSNHPRVQVIQQSMPNPAYIQGQLPVYNTQQGPIIVPSNIALHPGMNQQIQVITQKSFQPGQMPHMLTTTQGKHVVQGQPSIPGYAIPTSGSNSPATFVISQLGGVMQATNLIPAPPQQQGKPQEMQKMLAKGNNSNEMKVSSSQNASINSLVSSQPQGITTQAPTLIQPHQILSPIQYCNTQPQQQRGMPTQGVAPTTAMQLPIAPWQSFQQGVTGMPQVWATPGIQGSLLQGNQSFIIRAQQPEQGMIFHSAPPQAIQPHNQISGQQIKNNTSMEVANNVQMKTPISKTFSTILPISAQQQQIRPAASVSTQTNQSQTHLLPSNLQCQKSGTKVRTKNSCRGPNMSSGQKSDSGNQTKSTPTQGHILQPKMPESHTNGSLMTSVQSSFKQPQMLPQLDHQILAANQPQLIPHQMQMNIFAQQPLQQKPTTDNCTVMMEKSEMSPMKDLNQSSVAPMIINAAQPLQQLPQGMSQPNASMNQNSGLREDVGEANRSQIGTNVPENDPNWQHSSAGVNKWSNSSTNDEAGQSMKDGKCTKEDEANADVMKDEKDCKDTEKKSEKESAGPQKAVVRPQVLTHVIEGFVIQESSEPFAVNIGNSDNLLRNISVRDALSGNDIGEPPKKKSLVDGNETNSPTKEKEMATCQTCQKTDLRSKFKKSKRFCSLSCSKRYNVGCSARVGLYGSEEEKKNSGEMTDTNDSFGESSLSPPMEKALQSENSDCETPKVNPLNWSVNEVCEFIKTLPGCSEYVEDFLNQEVDGEALMLLKPDHLMSVMSMKLGPAVKIIAKIDTMRSDATPTQKQ